MPVFLKDMQRLWLVKTPKMINDFESPDEMEKDANCVVCGEATYSWMMGLCFDCEAKEHNLLEHQYNEYLDTLEEENDDDGWWEEEYF